MFLLAQDQMDQKAVMGDGLDFNLPITFGCLWAIFCADLVQDLEYQVRPYEVGGRADGRRRAREHGLPLRDLQEPAAEGVLARRHLAPDDARTSPGRSARSTGSSPPSRWTGSA